MASQAIGLAVSHRPGSFAWARAPTLAARIEVGGATLPYVARKSQPRVRVCAGDSASVWRVAKI